MANRARDQRIRATGTALALALSLAASPVLAETSPRLGPLQGPPSPWAAQEERERAAKLFGAIRRTLDEAATERQAQQSAPDGPIEDFLLRQFGADQNSRVRDLLGSAFEMITDTPVVEMQGEIRAAREQIARMKTQIAELKERRISAPDDAGVSGWVGIAEDRASISDDIEALEESIQGQQAKIEAIKGRFGRAMAEAGAPMPPEQIDLLLESVTGEDLVALAAAYQAVRGVSDQLRRLMDESGEDLAVAKRYYGMHTALIALLVEAQNRFLAEVDGRYLPRLTEIERDIQAAAVETQRLLRDDPTPAQRRALEANAESQQVAIEALRLYREHLLRQREQVKEARDRTAKELRVADNTLRTVEASFQLKRLMDSAATSFNALQSLEFPGLERVFENEQLRQEFRNLTDKLEPNS
ncbi:MAG: hypothetical protein AAFW46_09950 [Pseudomonadota bacterium]